MRKVVVLVVVALVLGLSAQAALAQEKQEPKKDETPASVAGKWSMSLDGPQGPMTIAVVFAVDGTNVTGTMSSQMGDTALEGQYVDGNLTFGITFDGGGGSMQISFAGKLKDADNLEGVLSGPMGEIPWKAVRVKY
ncbi:MAG: hypothetical protein NTY02_15085 [Acidobacteria bacterium]|nr:hypothetical protein [Acidobacteriota bacterium]